MIQNLFNTTHEEIVDCLHDAFADYSIPMKASYEYWKTRWFAARIDYNLSFGYFADGQLVGFVLHGIDDYDNKFSFFNMGTGVIPAFRGQRIVKQIYDHSYPLMKKAGIQQGVLEVITTNEKAIKAYKSAGFKIIRTYHSFNAANLDQKDSHSIKLKENYKLDDYLHMQDHHLCWEHNNQTILKDPAQFTALELKESDRLCAYALIKKSNKNVTQFGVIDKGWDRYGTSLFAYIETHFPAYRIINIDAASKSVMAFLKKNDFPPLLDQYEMKVDL